MARATQPVSINGLEFDALITEERSLKSTVPEYAVEKGYSVSDAIILEAETLSMTLFLTNTPVTWYRRHGSDPSRVNNVVKQLEALYMAGEPVTVTTSEASYTNMAIETISIRKSFETGYAREVPISFKKIRITSAATNSIPDSYGKSGATGANAGTANTSAGSSGAANTPAGSSGAGGSGGSGNNSGSGDSKSSILYGAASQLGIL